MGCRASPKLISDGDIWVSSSEWKELPECKYRIRQQVTWANCVGRGYL
ncbi:hypothetical protein [Methanosarcina sp. UBA5]|nr:hypothetical protein [Methanosarcina sp. UBA5]